MLAVLGAATAFAAAPTAVAATSPAAPSQAPPAPTQWVTDGAAFLSEPVRAALDARLARYETQSGHQVLVWIAHSTGTDPFEDWAVRAFSAWKVGRRGLDDGAVLFIMADDHKLRIKVGYGLEDKLTDIQAGRIISDVIVPRIRAGDRDGAARVGVEAILAALGGAGATGDAPVADQDLPGKPQIGWGTMLLLGLIGLGILVFVVTHPAAAVLFLTTLASNRRGGGGWGGGGFSGGGGGGFSGGGGRSGGGGASGSW